MENRTKICKLCFIITATFITALVYSHCNSFTRMERLENEVEEITKFIFGENSGGIRSFCKKFPTEMQVVTQEQPNYALESMGASIVHVEDEPINSVIYPLNVLISNHKSNFPENVLKPSMEPGSCYGFKGNKSSFTIKLSHKIIIRAITLEHIQVSVSPTGDISNAPKDFHVYGVDDLQSNWEILLGSFQYDNTKTRRAQTFYLNNDKSFKYCKINVLSNHGNPKQTCIYRIAVHGNLR